MEEVIILFIYLMTKDMAEKVMKYGDIQNLQTKTDNFD